MSRPTPHRRPVRGIHDWLSRTALALTIMFFSAILASRPAYAQTYAESVLYRFTGVDGNNPFTGLVIDAQGNLYGTTYGGGASNFGTVFKVDTTGKESVLYSFTGGTDGAFPLAGLIIDAQDNLYGTAYMGGIAVGGENPYFGQGVVFKVDPTGKETVLYSFAGVGAGDGGFPLGVLVMDAQGNLYGTTSQGGVTTCAAEEGSQSCGTVFKLDTNGNETLLHVFTGSGGDGALPQGALAMDSQGNLYGTTLGAGQPAYEYCTFGCGTVFKVTATANETVVHSFGGEATADGALPTGGLVIDAQGNLYGTTSQGGPLSDLNHGTVFKVDSNGNETVLYNFSAGELDGYYPQASVVMDTQGNLYGTTFKGGNFGCPEATNLFPGCGVVFKVDTNGNQTVLYSFSGSESGPDGSEPQGGVVRDAQGNLYGTTAFGGDVGCAAAYPGGSNFNYVGCGTVFKLTLIPFSVGATAVTVSPGATAGNTSTITVTPSGGFTGSVTLTATITSSPAGAQDPPTLSFGSTSPVNITSAAAGTATLTISTTAASNATLDYLLRPGSNRYRGGAGLSLILGIAFLAVPPRGRNWWTRLGLLALPVVLSVGLLACGGGSSGGGTANPGTTPGNYTVTVSATSGSATATATVTLTVQ